MQFEPINVNPVDDGLYMWGDVSVEISPDASSIVIFQNGSAIRVNGSFFNDVSQVLEMCRKKIGGEQGEAILLNTIPTSRSLPSGEW